MEETKSVVESISKLQYYQIIRSQIEHEDNLINQRLSWFVASQACLFSAYAIHLNSPSQVRLQNFATQQEILFSLIPLVAIGASILTYITVIAAMLATANLRRLLKTHMNEKDSALLPPVQWYRQTLLLGQASPILMPFLFMISWIVLLLKAHNDLGYAQVTRMRGGCVKSQNESDVMSMRARVCSVRLG